MQTNRLNMEVSHLDWSGIPFKTGSMEIRGKEYKVKLYEHIPVEPETWKPRQFDPEREWTDVDITTPDGKVYWGNIEAIGHLKALFGDSPSFQQPVYSEGTLTSVVKRADIPTVTAYFRIVIGELGFEKLCSQRKLRWIEPSEDEQEKPKVGKAYKKWRAEYRARFANAQVPVNSPDDFDLYNGRVKVYLKTGEGMLVSQFVTMGYLDRILREHKETGKITIDHVKNEIYTPHGIHIPFVVILREINEQTVSQTIDSLVEQFKIENHFTNA